MPDLSAMPKAELHLHLEGAPRWSTLRDAHRRHCGKVLPETPPWYAPDFRFANFGEFQALFQDYIDPWLRSPNGYAELTRDVIDGLVAQNIRYAEVNFAASMVKQRGVSLDHVWAILTAEVERAKQQNCIIRIFVGLMRPEGVEAAIAWVKRSRSVPVVAGFDLQGDEADWPAHLFKPAFDLAREAGKKVKAHAGEMTGPENIRTAVETLNLTQIGHGTSAIQDPDVVALLRDRQVTVEMCPTSNERLQNVASYQEHPILAMDAAGVNVTINSDDPTFFGLNLSDEFVRLMAERDVTPSDLKRWTQNAFR